MAGEPGQLKGPSSLLKEASVPAESAPLLPGLVRGGPAMGMAQRGHCERKEEEKEEK